MNGTSCLWPTGKHRRYALPYGGVKLAQYRVFLFGPRHSPRLLVHWFGFRAQTVTSSRLVDLWISLNAPADWALYGVLHNSGSTPCQRPEIPAWRQYSVLPIRFYIWWVPYLSGGSANLLNPTISLYAKRKKIIRRFWEKFCHDFKRWKSIDIFSEFCVSENKPNWG